jgi:hypothetical protein
VNIWYGQIGNCGIPANFPQSLIASNHLEPEMPQPSSVLILGARGRVGQAAARAFAQAGWTVHAQLRPGATGPQIAGVQWLHADP